LENINLTPDTLERLIFEDVPFLKVAQAEHDRFAEILRENGVEVVYLEDLVAETLDSSHELKVQFLKQFIEEGGVKLEVYKE
ncbi:arginine deiminase family protein, partial [Streptobacillus moniliformis]|uniref:arginine deiminase family protein n=1 Tax=Streptobacillus moniliformis TaxID=34105 RepID=UPI000AAEB82A